MPTAIIYVRGKKGFITTRTLLDTCSTVNLITSKLADLLNLTVNNCSISVGALNNLTTNSSKFVKTTIQSINGRFQRDLDFLIVPKITDAVPSETFPRDLFDIPKNLQLADPKFHVPQEVDLLLASGTTFSTFALGQISQTHDKVTVILQKTSLGWIVAGGDDRISITQRASCHIIRLDALIERFWLIEGINNEPSKSRDETACEHHYTEHTQRDTSGRYIVRLPFRSNKFELGESKNQALNRFHSLQRKLNANPDLKREYEAVMQEYIDLNHMTLTTDTKDGYYLPHHAVIKSSSETTKVRVVFDASAKTSTGISLNDALLVGPTIQNNIFEQILKLRIHAYIVTADIAKMYRQVLMHPEDRKYQRVLWYHQGLLRTFELNTVTFGVSSAPFLAIRTIQQLARDEEAQFPRASKILLRDLYVDDLLTGADSLDEIISIRNEVIALLKKGGFEIRQWASNHPEALNDMDKVLFDLDCIIKDNTIHKTLGIIWDSHRDKFQYKIESINLDSTITKRKLLSEVSKIFDPLGLIGPVVFYAKVLMQDCWKSKITWDESLPQEIHTKWLGMAEQLHILQELSIDRQVLIKHRVRIEIHGFCDASKSGYGACIYLKSTDRENNALVRLVCAKSRIAPIGNITIPQLELSAASLLKKLYLQTRSQFSFNVDQIVLWSDSTIALHWIHKAPHLLKTFEANRVTDIQSLGEQVQWRHVRTNDNPADALSRGQLPADFIQNTIWFTGPTWLAQSEENWPPLIQLKLTNLPGLKQRACLAIVERTANIYSGSSSYPTLLRAIILLIRWRNKSPKKEPITVAEQLEAEQRLVKLVQHENFSVEITRLKTTRDTTPGEPIVTSRKTTRFDNLQPFIDESGIVRVGGRLKKSKLLYNQRHPILLPAKHHVTDLIIRHYHQSNQHGGIQSTLYSIRERFWILNGRDQVRKIVRRCVDCIRAKPKLLHAPMADLPSSRVTESPAFSHVGIDYFGPILIKEKKFRNKTMLKTYGCIFVCMKSKAVHIELASDLSSEGFLAAFRRFISRRGIPEHVYSDNGTNFVGADKELKQIYDLIGTDEFRQSIEGHALSNRITWHYNPPLSPHFGGLWEAAVKSAKHHLKRILKDHFLTYEQLNTLLIEIEATLNSRPLCVLSSDPNDPLAITPAHLLIGKSFKTLPEKNLVPVADNRLSTWNFITKARQDFWKRWHTEYLNELQVRQKWNDSNGKIETGSVVILIEKNIPSGRWPLGVVLEVFPGSDGVTRVVNVKTASGIYKRNITNLCVLPLA